MDHIQDLSAFQGVILSADNLHSFAKLKSRGGNEEKVNYVIEKLLKFLKEKNYITENGLVKEKAEEYRKLALYIVLNADLPFLEEMTEMEGVDAVIWTLPTIPQYLLCELFWNLDMHTFLYEIIAFCSPHLALQVADAFITNMKYLNPAVDLDRVRLISAALYRLICRLHFFRDGAAPALLTAALNSFQICLNNFTNPPNADNVLNLHRDEQYKYLGRSLSIMLNLIEECLGHFSTKQEFEADGFHSIYLATHHPESIMTKTLDFDICDSSNDAILQCLNKCHTFLLDDCTTQVMNISVDIFCAWSEYEENGKSMQQSIGELCFKLRSILMKTAGISDHTLVSMLKQISREPVQHKDIINDTDDEVIVEKINAQNEESSLWLAALLHKHDLCQNLTLLLLLESNLSMLNEEQSLQLFKKITQHLNDDQENSEYLKVLAIKAFRQCENTVKDSVISEQFSTCLHDKMENGDFNNMMTEIFNKLTATADADPSDILTVFLQNPKQVCTKIFKLAAENSKQTDIMLKAIDCLEKYCNYYYQHDTEPCIIKVTHFILENCLDTDTKQTNFVNFISKLKQRDIIPGNKLLLLIVMPTLHKGLLKKDIVGIKVQIKLLMAAYTIQELVQFRAPILAMLAQVLEVVRWKLTTFEAAMPSTLDLVLDLQIEIFNTYEAEIPEKELTWLRSKVRSLQPLNMYYYQRLRGARAGLLSSCGMRTNASAEQITAVLVQVLCSLSAREWSIALDELSAGSDAAPGPSNTALGPDGALDAVHGAALLLAAAERAHRTDTSWPCLLNCYTNFTLVVKNKYFRDPPTDEQVMSVISKIVNLINMVDEECVDEFSSVVLPLLAYVAEKRSDLTTGIATFIRGTVKNTQFSAILSQAFTARTVQISTLC